MQRTQLIVFRETWNASKEGSTFWGYKMTHGKNMRDSYPSHDGH